MAPSSQTPFLMHLRPVLGIAGARQAHEMFPSRHPVSQPYDKHAERQVRHCAKQANDPLAAVPEGDRID